MTLGNVIALTLILIAGQGSDIYVKTLGTLEVSISRRGTEGNIIRAKVFVMELIKDFFFVFVLKTIMRDSAFS